MGLERKPELKHWFQCIGIIFLVPIILLYLRIGYWLGDHKDHFTTDVWDAWEDIYNNFRWLLGKKSVDWSIERSKREYYLRYKKHFFKHTELDKEQIIEIVNIFGRHNFGTSIFINGDERYISCSWEGQYEDRWSINFSGDICWINKMRETQSHPISEWKKIYARAEMIS